MLFFSPKSNGSTEFKSKSKIIYKKSNMNLFHFETGLWVVYVVCFKDVFMTFNLGRVCLSHCMSLKESCKDEGQRKKAERTIKELMF